MSEGPSFSQRMGYVAPKAIQFESLDLPLKNLLWHEISDYLENVKTNAVQSRQVDDLCKTVWVEFFKLSSDTFGESLRRWSFQERTAPLALDQRELPIVFTISHSRNYFFNEKTPWYRVFDLIEFLLRLPANPEFKREIAAANLNARLEQEKSAYRIVNGQFVPITNQSELKAVEAASKPATTALAPVAVHIQQALNLLADRTEPDYRNSIKESISAVESLCKFIAGMPSATLGPALDKTAKELDLNDHVRDGMKAFYKYTSDAHGIRHGLKDHEHPEQADALFMAVTCSAFVNFVTEKARQQGKLLI